MNKIKILCLLVALVFSIGCSHQCKSKDNKESTSKSETKGNEEIPKESISKALVLDPNNPNQLPKDWEKHVATQNIVVDYAGSKVNIPKGANYYTYEGKIAIGWHGSYDPPQDMQ